MNSGTACIAGADLSQSVNRIPHTYVRHADEQGISCAPTLLTNTLRWLMYPDLGAGTHGKGLDLHSGLVEERPLASQDKMMLQGWPCGSTGKGIPSPVCLRRYRGILNKMSGNMFTGSVLLTVLASSMCRIPWADGEKAGDMGSIDGTTVNVAWSACQSL